MKNECQTNSIEDLAEILGIGRSTAYAAVRNGTIPSIKVGKRVLIPKVSLHRLLSGQTAKNERRCAESGTEADMRITQ
jgi:excisionase family DNA binding protein